ncbi:uncharacterized protein N7459_001937 [Penicillium hispanicum]|uniref:uncharacterized protein n=1 Tax=Penicillium hispanicum TaxID=1080232 RepID=UPI0025424375|nr:uncharacterized protein N7459_001937 [Penicillium hispanicum]KAJ5591568.1 hypothetical protein N7459_001937 [Penicillium hispanicum]
MDDRVDREVSPGDFQPPKISNAPKADSLFPLYRLFIWYTLLTPFFWCPSNLSDLNNSSPRVCKPYLIARSHVVPHIAPYYDAYAAPYIEHARPYVEVVNQHVYTPASKIAYAGYDKYGAPAWQHAQAYGTAQWETRVSPQIKAAQDKAHQLYMTEVDPYVQQGVAVVSPYYQKATHAAFTVYWDHLVPFYTRSQPFIGKTYATGHTILTTQVMPGAQYTWSSIVYFANSSLWPQITGLYSEQVEPQLVKIGQRLASYREGKRLRSVIEDMDRYAQRDDRQRGVTLLTHFFISTSEPSVSSTVSTTEETAHASTSLSTITTTETPSPHPTLSPEQEAEQARDRIASDLQRWQDKFAVAADKGIEDLEERLEEVVAALVASSANGHGQSLSNALQAVAAQQVDGIKSRIDELAGSLPEENAPEAEESARDQLVSDIRSSAISVRDRAHALREWSLSFDAELMRRVSAAVNSTLDVLDSIRDLGLQEIGMRWAWMDGVTYKDWARYHALKAQLEDWRNEIHKIGMNHKSVTEAKAVATTILDSAMELAEHAAKELVRLKDVGFWKIAAREVSDNFDTRTEPPPPRPIPVDEPDESSEDSDIENDETVDEASGKPVASAASEEEDDIQEIPGADSNESAVGQSDITSDSKTTAEVAPDSEDDETISSGRIEDEQPISAKPAWGVAAADANSPQAPIIDDDEDSQERIHNLASQTADAHSQASSSFAGSTANAKILYDIAKSQIMGQMAQSSAPAHIQILSSIESAYSGAVQYATEEFESRIGAVKATPTPSSAGPLVRISSIASSRLNEGLSLASEQLASIQPITSAPSSAGLQPFVLDAQRRYYEAVGLAHDHYTAFVSTASEAVYGTPTPAPGPRSFQDLVDEAGSQYEQVSSLASASLAAVVASASSMASAVDDGKSQSIIDDAFSKYNAALSAASSSLSMASASASSALYGTTTGHLEALSSQASENWENLVAKASEQVYGTPAPYLEQVMQGQIQRFGAIQAIVSELLVGKQPPFTESVMSKLREVYETPYATAAFASASSYAGEAFQSASSAADAIITAIPSADDVMKNANDQLGAAVEAASIGIYGTPKGPYERATDAAADAYSTASVQVSSAIYGKESSYIDVAQDAIAEIQSKASAAIYGGEPGVVESANSRLAAAVESAQSRLADFTSSSSSVASEAAETAASDVDGFLSSVKGAASSLKDEL